MLEDIGLGLTNVQGSSWSPAQLTASGFWQKGNYAGTTWTGSGSAGSSGSNSLADATHGPTATNGEPVFNGTNQYFANQFSIATLMSLASGTIFCCFNASAATADNVNTFNNPGLLSDSGNGLVFAYSTAGVVASIFDTGYRTIKTAAATGSTHAACMRWDSANLNLNVDGVDATPVGCGAIGVSGANTLFSGINAGLTFPFAGTVHALITLQSAITAADVANLHNWAKQQYGSL